MLVMPESSNRGQDMADGPEEIARPSRMYEGPYIKMLPTMIAAVRRMPVAWPART